MTHRTVICVLLVGVALIAACGLSNDGHDPSPTPVAASSLAAPPTEQSESSQVAAPPPSPATSVKPGYDGAYSLEERIFASPVIARVRLDSVSSSVESGPTYHGIKNRALLEFHFSVWEYLKGDGHENIVAVWAAAQLFDTRQEAEAALPAVVAARDTRWDDRDAIVFLQQFVTSVPSTRQIDRYYLSSGSDSPWYPDDRYSINSRFNNLWLPTEASGSAQSQPGGDEQRFLLYWPLSIWAASRITLGEMRARIAAVTAKLNAGDGSEEYGECVRSTYQEERRRRFREVKYPDKVVPAGFPPQNHAMGSGLPTASTLYEDDQGYGYAPDNRSKFWLDGGDADLFSVEFGEAIPYDLTGDGVNDGINFTRRVVTSRPIPEGVYKFHSNDLSVYFLRCDGFTLRYEWTVTVTAPHRHSPRGVLRPRDRRLGHRRGRLGRRPQAHYVHRRQRRVGDNSAYRV